MPLYSHSLRQLPDMSDGKESGHTLVGRPAVTKAEERLSRGPGGVFSRQCFDAPEKVFPRTSDDMLRLGTSYFTFVSRKLPVVRVRKRGDEIRFTFAGEPLLSFEFDEVIVQDRSAAISYRISGGLLNSHPPAGGTLSLSMELTGQSRCRVCVAVSDYHPRLNGFLGGVAFKAIQTPVHRWLGEGFVRWAARTQWAKRGELDG